MTRTREPSWALLTSPAAPEAVGANTLSLVQATVAAAQAQLRIERLEQQQERRRPAPAEATGPAPSKPLYRDSLQILGREQGLLHVAGAGPDPE